jgi:peptidoglycan/LPS O-acetylase OafA/YrhL
MTESTRIDSSNLDILRSLAVTFVVVSHLPIPWLSTLANYHFQALGLLGVLIFFVHTCLVLMFSLERQTACEGDRHRALLFLVRRVFRIYPLSIASVLLVSVIAYHSSGEIDVQRILSNILLIQNITNEGSTPGALWSLPYEVQMYLFLPALYLIVGLSKISAPIYIGAIWLAATGFTLALWKLGMNYHLVKYLPCFIPGVLAYSLRKSTKRLKPFWLFLYVATLAIMFPVAVAMGAKENILAWPVCLGLGLLIPKCSEINHIWLKRIGKTIAKYSFGIYLVHGPVIQFVFEYCNAMPVIFQSLIFGSCTCIISYFSYHLIENPFIKFGRRLTSRLPNPSISTRISQSS